jgi:hypothetical protein
MDREDIVANLTAELRDLRIRVAQLEADRPNRETERSAKRAAATVFKQGDRININKTLKKPAVWDNTVVWNQEQAQRATVTHVYKGQVWFVTDNGVKTWRAINNITRRIEE